MAGVDRTGKEGSGGEFAKQATRWATPAVFDSTDLERSPEALARAKMQGGCANLREQVGTWATATVADSVGARNKTSGRREGSRHHDGTTLVDAATLWALPTTRDHKDGSSPSEETPTNAMLGRQAPRMTQGGKWFSACNPNLPLRYRLNPRFVAWLMGLRYSWITPLGSNG
jgi:hypothetical protein